MPKGEVIPSGPEGLGTKSAEGALKRIRFSHDLLVDYMISTPNATNRQLATLLGVTETWVSRVICSDAFQARLAQRKDELVDPIIQHSIEEKLKGLVDLSTEVISEKLESSRNPDLAVKALTIGVAALGYGARDRQPVQTNNFVVMLPEKDSSSEAWASRARGEPRGVPAEIVDVSPVPSTPAGEI